MYIFMCTHECKRLIWYILNVVLCVILLMHEVHICTSKVLLSHLSVDGNLLRRLLWLIYMSCFVVTMASATFGQVKPCGCTQVPHCNANQMCGLMLSASASILVCNRNLWSDTALVALSCEYLWITGCNFSEVCANVFKFGFCWQHWLL